MRGFKAVCMIFIFWEANDGRGMPSVDVLEESMIAN